MAASMLVMAAEAPVVTLTPLTPRVVESDDVSVMPIVSPALAPTWNVPL